jgi:hypothetical protein
MMPTIMTHRQVRKPSRQSRAQNAPRLPYFRRIFANAPRNRLHTQQVAAQHEKVAYFSSPLKNTKKNLQCNNMYGISSHRI